MSSTTDTEAGTGKKFRLKENRKGTTKLESRDTLCISMLGMSDGDAHRLLNMLSSVGFCWISGHELRAHSDHKKILARSHRIILHTNTWHTTLNSVKYCKRHYSEDTITLEHLESLIEDFLYEHQS